MAEPKRKRDSTPVDADSHQDDKDPKKRKKPAKKAEEEEEEEEEVDPNDGEDNEDEENGENGEKEEQEENDDEEKTDGKIKWEEFDSIEDDPFHVLSVKQGTEYNNEEVKAEDQVEALALLGRAKAAQDKFKALEESDKDYDSRVSVLTENIDEIDKVFIFRLPGEGKGKEKAKEKAKEKKGEEHVEGKFGLELCFFRTSDAEYILVSDDDHEPQQNLIVGLRGAAALVVCAAFAYTNLMSDGVESLFPADQDFENVSPKLLLEVADKYFKMFCANQLPEAPQKKE